MSRDMKTIVRFDLIKLGANTLVVDPNSLYVNGFFKWHLLNEFLFDRLPGEDDAKELLMNMTEFQCTEVEIEIGEDSDDYGTWIDYKILNHKPK